MYLGELHITNKFAFDLSDIFLAVVRFDSKCSTVVTGEDKKNRVGLSKEQ